MTNFLLNNLETVNKVFIFVGGVFAGIIGSLYAYWYLGPDKVEELLFEDED